MVQIVGEHELRRGIFLEVLVEVLLVLLVLTASFTLVHSQISHCYD